VWATVTIVIIIIEINTYNLAITDYSNLKRKFSFILIKIEIYAIPKEVW
jgi:hypothetical protein